MTSYEKFACPCCGYKTLGEPPPGTYDICPICYWEDDAVQYHDRDYVGGANMVSLRQAQANFRTFGAESRASLRFVRKPSDDERRTQDTVSIEGAHNKSLQRATAESQYTRYPRCIRCVRFGCSIIPKAVHQRESYIP